MGMFDFSEEHKMLINTMRKFVDKEYSPEVVREIDKNDRYPKELLGKLAALDLLAITVDEKYGGIGRDIIGACIINEELARRSMALSATFVESTFFGGENISKLGNEIQKKEFLPKVVKGEISFCYALTEPNAGSDVASLQTYAHLDGDEFVINGSKVFISGARECDYMLLLARTDRSAPKRQGLTFIIVDGKTPGITARPIEKIGVHGLDTCSVAFEDVRVPIERILGGPEALNKGWQQLMSTLEVEHLQVAAGCVGLAKGALAETLRYVKERTQFGQPIGKFQVVQHKLADMATEVQAATFLTYNVASLVNEGKSCVMESSMAKLYASEAAKKVSLEGVQLHGGYGYTTEYDIQRYARDSILMPIGGGTSEIQRNLIAKSLGL